MASEKQPEEENISILKIYVTGDRRGKKRKIENFCFKEMNNI